MLDANGAILPVRIVWTRVVLFVEVRLQNVRDVPNVALRNPLIHRLGAVEEPAHHEFQIVLVVNVVTVEQKLLAATDIE